MPALVIDTNLLLLMTVGIASKSLISRHKRLGSYQEADFDLLMSVVSRADKVVVTPHVLAETSNLAGYIEHPARALIFDALKALVRKSTEEHRPAVEAIDQAEFGRLGLTDATLLLVTNERATLLTADMDLYLAALQRGIRAENFAHMRVREGLL